MKSKGNNFGESCGAVYEIRDLVENEAIIPAMCCKTEESAKRQFAIFLFNNKLKPSTFRLNRIGFYDRSQAEKVCEGFEVNVEDYMKNDFEQNVSDKE